MALRPQPAGHFWEPGMPVHHAANKRCKKQAAGWTGTLPQQGLEAGGRVGMGGTHNHQSIRAGEEHDRIQTSRRSPWQFCRKWARAKPLSGSPEGAAFLPAQLCSRPCA